MTLRGRLARNLSGGMQRRLELACALVHDPDVGFLDEPTAGIDPILRRSIWEELHRRRDAGVTLVVTTQHVAESERCDVVVLIADGELLACDQPANLRRIAFGGDVLHLDTDAPIDPEVLADVDGLLAVRPLGPTRLAIVADRRLGGQSARRRRAPSARHRRRGPGRAPAPRSTRRSRSSSNVAVGSEPPRQRGAEESAA